MDTKIRNPKIPSEKDLKVLAFLNEGNRIDSAKALRLFKTTGLRDILYRLRCAGHTINFEDVPFTSYDGSKGYYREWFTTDYKAIKAGHKTEKAMKGDSISDISKKMAKIANIQQDLFPAYQDTMKNRYLNV